MALLSRRLVLFLPVCVSATKPALAFRTTRFWNNEDPSAWTPQEISQLTTNSPWAKLVTAELAGNNSSLGARVPSMGGRGGRRGGGGNTGVSNLPKFQGIVRWASAKPIREALKLKFAESLEGHYVISVSGLPILSGSDGGDDSFAGLKEQTSLLLKHGEPIQPGVAHEDVNDRSTIYFGFLPQLVSVSDAKTATFSMNTGSLAVRAKFNLEEMKYRGQLAV